MIERNRNEVDAPRDVIVCEKCGTRMFDTDRTREEMVLHEDECDGIDDPRRRFQAGERIQFSNFGLKRLDEEQRGGRIIGFNGVDDNCVIVEWDRLAEIDNYAHGFLTHADEDNVVRLSGTVVETFEVEDSRVREDFYTGREIIDVEEPGTYKVVLVDDD